MGTVPARGEFEMGLDLVEIIMDIEERFGVEIPDEDASRVNTVADLIDAVCKQLDTAAQKCEKSDQISVICHSSRAFYRFRKELTRILPLGRRDVKPSARLEELIPRQVRRQTWQALRLADLRLPELTLSRSAWAVVLVAPLVPLLLIAAWAAKPGYLLAYPILLAIVLRAASPLRIEVPEECSSAGQAARFLSVHPAVVGQSPPRNEVAAVVRQVIALQLQLPLDSIREDSRLIEDLRV
jgi:hypothetical protein